MKSTTNINLDMISVLFNQPCRLKLDVGNKVIDGNYTIIALKTENIDFVDYFIDIFQIVLDRIGEYPNPQVLGGEIEKLVELFRHFSYPPKNTVQGLWAELFVIERSHNPEYLIKSWHVDANSTYDFDDGKDKIEVKSTSKPKRVHHFSLNQLLPNNSADLIVASVFVVQTGMGKTIFNLKELIERRVSSIELKFKLNDLIMRILGSDFAKAYDFHFDYQLATEEYCFFHYKDIPAIDVKNIPSQVSNVHFECDLTGCVPIANIVEKCPSSPLINSL